MHPGDVRTSIGGNNGLAYRMFKRTFIWPMLKDPVISGEAIYYLAAAPEMSGVSGKFFHLTIEEEARGSRTGSGAGQTRLGHQPGTGRAGSRAQPRSLITRWAASFPVRIDIGSPEGLNVHCPAW